MSEGLTAETLREEMGRIGDPPGPDPEDRLAHVLRVYENDPDDKRLITCTTNCYAPPNRWTGLTMGDLRQLADRFGVSMADEKGDRDAGQ